MAREKLMRQKAVLFLFNKGLTLQKMRTVKTLFNLHSDKEIGGEHTLLIEAGSDYWCEAFLHKGGNRIDDLRFYTFDETEAESAFAELVPRAKKTEVQNTIVCSAFSQALLVPNKFFKEEHSMLEALYGLPAQAYFHDNIPEWQLTNHYSMPAAFRDALQTSFPSLHFFHAYTPAIKVYNGYIADNQITVHFSPRHFRVLFKKDATIQLAQTYAYKTPLDVVYYLLKICYEFGVSQQDLHLVLSGLIEKDSAMFTEMHQYFANVHFAHPPEITLPNDSHPAHFFTSLYNLASCAS